ncbi:MAG: GNAT family N-acetyltransferase [Alphaproteobacteria bacterium]|nr:GNAT family N-acetyltransferase [Alphaproteobacteria bacterium]
MADPYEIRDGRFLISTDQAKIDVNYVHSFLKNAYWSPGIPHATVEKALRHSLSFGVYETDDAGKVKRQVGSARVVTDYATFGYISDVFIDPDYRNLGLAEKLVNALLAHPDLQGLRRICLTTRDAQPLYLKCGFTPPKYPARWLEVYDENLYKD